MTGVVLTVVAIWLVLSVLAGAACALVARGGRSEDLHRLDEHRRGEERDRLLAAVPRPR